LDNTTTKTYTFTPTVGQCATTTTLTITVNPSITPTFTVVSPICSGGSLSALPTTSNNSITGTWSPALDNTTTKTYTFTPTVGQCATTTTLTVTVKSGIDFEIKGNCVNGSYIIESKALSNSYNSTTASYQWQDNLGNNIGSNEATLNVSSLLASTSVVEEFPITYNLIVTSSDGCTKTKNSIVYGAFCAIPKGISPDGDSKNDEFDLTGLGVKELHIFNRYGTEAYNFTNYTKEWHGQSNGGDELPDGTYFYSIHKMDGTSATGWVYINRKQ
jgi:gliding motility-associated-like protein